MPVRTPDIVGSYFGGIQARQQQDAGNSRNALLQMEAEQAPRDIANRNALADRQQQQFTQEQQIQALTQGKAAAEHIAQHPQAKAFAAGQFPAFVQMAEQRTGKPWAALTDQEVQAFAGDVAAQSAAKLGLSPAQRPTQLETVEGPGGSILQRDPTNGGLKMVLGREPAAPKPDKPTSRFRAMSPEEIQQAGLPAGSSAQVDLDTGKIDVISKRDNSAVLSQKDATTARNKLTILKVARKQLESLKNTFTEGRTGMNAFGPGQGMLPTQAGKKFDAALAQIRGTFTGIKRVPGVGSMSDYESKLDAAQFPSRNDYESVIEQKLQGMEDQLALLENGYTGLLSGGNGEQAPQQQTQPPQQQAPPQAIEYLRQNPQFKGAFQQKYGYLPDGI